MIEETLRSTLLFLSRREELKDVATGLGPIRRLAERFVAGMDAASAIDVAEQLQRKGCTSTFDHLGEDVSTKEETARELEAYRRLLDRIVLKNAPANVSVKLSQLGLGLDFELAVQNARQLVSEAKKRHIFVRLDMEGSALTTATLDVFRRLREEFELNDVGVALQSYLRRSEADARALLRLPARIRLCKGAYREPPDIAFPDKRDVDRSYVRIMRLLLDSGVYHGIATHDPKMIDATVQHAQTQGIPKSSFEFQMLYGVRRDLQESLAKEGYNVRVYVPYGQSWYPYVMRRMAERPANLWFVLKNAVRG